MKDADIILKNTRRFGRMLDGTEKDAASTALVSALHRYMLAAEDETSKARQARNRQVVAAYGDGVAVSQLADIMGMSHKAVYKILDSQNDG